MTLFDFIAILIILVSCVVGFIRGAAREVIAVVAFVAAVAVAVLALHFSGPIARRAIHPNVLANSVAILVVFILAYILLKVLGSGLARRVQNTEALGGVDRMVGLAFGLVRALVVLGVFYLAFNAATPAERVPPWIKDAKLYPLAAASDHVLMALAPEGSAVAGKVAPALVSAVRDGGADKVKTTPPSGSGGGYDEQSRKSVDSLVEKTR